METLILLIVLTILILIIANNSKFSSKLTDLSKEIERLRQSISTIEKPVIKPSTIEKPVVKTVAEERIIVPVPEEKIPVQESIKRQEPEINPIQTAHETLFQEKAVEEKPVSIQQKTQERQPVQKPVEPKKVKVPTDIEKFVGENLISKIGIIILVLGVGFFVKYAIDQNWIGVYGRTAIGLLAGGLLVSLAHYMRKSYTTFSSLLTGGGFAVFYLTIAIAFHQYHIFSQTAAFIILVVITIFSVLLSLLYDKKELAIFSQLGGYAAPFMISTGEGNYVVLFSYLLILNAGLIVLAYYKRWHILNLIAFVFTVLIYSGWLATTFWGNTNLPYLGAIVFASAFYVVFFLVNILNNLREQKPFKAIEITLILSNNLFFFLSGLTIFHKYEHGIYQGLFTVLVGLFNFGWVVYLYRKDQIDKTLIYLLIGLVMSYISLAVPIQLHGHSITLFWTAELVILLWLSQVSGIKILKTGHLIILGLVIASLAMDWSNLYMYSKPNLRVLFNQAFITGFVVLIGLGVSQYFLRKEKDEQFIPNIIGVKGYSKILSFILFIAAFMVPFLELQYQMDIFYKLNSFQTVVYGIYIFAYLFTVLQIIKPSQWLVAYKWVFALCLAALFFYLILFNTMVVSVRDSYIYGNKISLGNFMFHYLALVFIAGTIISLYRNMHMVLSESGIWQKLFRWFISFFAIFIASSELDNLILLANYTAADSFHSILKISHKVGYPILWGICAFILIIWGMKSKIKDYRIQALCLLGLIILKLFLFDVWDMNEGGRIAAFIFLGIILLVVSFLYQKLKKLLLDDPENKSNI